MHRRYLIPAAMLGGCAGAVIAAPAGAGHGGDAAAAWSTWLPEIAFVLASLLVVLVWVRSRAYRLPRRPPDAITLPPEWLFGLLAAMLIAPMVGLLVLTWVDPAAAAAVEAARQGGEQSDELSMEVKLTLAAAAGQLAIGGVYVFLLSSAPAPPGREPGGAPRRWPRIAAVIGGVLMLVPVFPLLVTSNLLMGRIAAATSDEAPETIAHRTLEAMLGADPDGWRLAMIGIVVVVVPIVEELLYRGLVQELLSRLRTGHWPAIVLTSLAFTAAHWNAADWHVLPSLFALSLALGWVYARSGRLLACIALHGAFNAANVALGMLMQ